MSEPDWGDLAAGLRRGGPIVEAAPLPAFIDWEDFFTKDRSEPEWLFEPVLARGRGHSIFAKGGSRKSLFTLWMATRLVRAGHVVIYADYEMSEDDLYDRLTDMDCTDPDGLALLRYLLLPTLPPLNTAAGAQAIGDVVDVVTAGHPGRHVAVVIDTISRAVVGEENSNDTIQEFYRHTGLALKQRGVTYLRLDHTGHEGKHARGGSAKQDDVDVAWHLSETDDKGLKLAAGKRRMGWVPEEVFYAMRTDPVLEFVARPRAWPAGVSGKAAELDACGVPLGASRKAARAALVAAGVTPGKNTLLGEALRFRRVEAERLVRSGLAVYRDDGQRVEEL